MKVTAGSIQAGIWGETKVKDLTLSLPMEDSPCLIIPELHISHSALPLILLGNSVTVNSVRVINPTANIREDENGRWNVQEFASCLRQSASGQNSRQKVNLPELDIVDGVSVVTNRDGRLENIGPFHFHGTPQDSGRWDFDVNISPNVAVSGRVAAGADWAHEIKFDIKDLHNVVEDLVPRISETLCMSGKLYGHVREGELTGNVKLDSLQYGKTQTQGILGVNVSAAGLVVRFEDITVRGVKSPEEVFNIAGGSVRLDQDELKVDGIGIEARGVSGNLTGYWNWTRSDGKFSGSWAGKSDQRGICMEGTWDGSASWPRMGRKEVDVSISARGDCSWGDWHGTAKVLGSGSTLSRSQWQISVPRISCRLKHANIAFEDVSAEVAAEWPSVRLVSLHSSNPGELKAEGEFLADNGSWTVSVEAEKWKAEDWQHLPVDLKLTAGGNRQNVTVEQFRVTQNNIRLEAAGKVALPSAEIRDTHAKVSWVSDPPPAGAERLGGISGELQCEAAVTGTAWPLSLRIMSELSGENITLNRKVISTVKIPWQAQIDTERIKYEAERFELFGGNWSMSGEYEFYQPSRQLILSASDVSLPPMVELLGLPLKSKGLMAVKLQAELPSPDINALTLSGSWRIRDMVLGTVAAENADGNVRIDNGVATFDRIHLERSQGRISGSASFDLNRPQYVSVEMEARQWPLDFSDHNVTFVTSGKGGATLDLLKRTAEGNGDISAAVAIDDKTFGNLSAEIAVTGRTVDINDMTIEALGGSVDAAARFDLDNRLASRVNVEWHDLSIGALADWRAELKDVSGTSSGTLTVAQADGRRPLEPLKLEIRADVSDGHYRNVQFGSLQASGHIGTRRLLIERSELQIMNGLLKARGSLRRRGDEFLTYVLADFSQLELDQFAQFFRKDENEVPGRLTGRGVLVVFSDFSRMTGELDVKLSESDLAGTVVVSTLYDTLNAKLGQTKPIGEGQVKLRFEGSTVSIPSFTYFNRGLEVRGTGAVDDITKGRKSPVRGYAIGSVRPLKGIRLPGTEDLDRLMAALQSGVSSVEVKGTLGEPEAVPVPFKQISNMLRALLWHQLGR